MSLEHAVTEGRVTSLVIAYDPARAQLELRTVPGAPETPVRRVVFTNVRDYAEDPFDPALPRDPSDLESLVGLDIHPREATTLYVIVTDEREVSFYADKDPTVEVLGARG